MSETKTTFACTGCPMMDITHEWPPELPVGWTRGNFVYSSGDKGNGLFHSKACHKRFKESQAKSLEWCEKYDEIKKELARLKKDRATLKKITIIEDCVEFTFTKGWTFCADIGTAVIHKESK